MADTTDATGGQWVTLADAAAAMRCSDRTIRRRMRDGSLPYRKDGARLWVHLADDARSNVDTGGPGGADADRAALLAEVARLADLVHRQDGEIARLWEALQREQTLAMQRAQIEAPSRGWRWPWQRGD